jgi:hypothetical protein
MPPSAGGLPGRTPPQRRPRRGGGRGPGKQPARRVRIWPGGRSRTRRRTCSRGAAARAALTWLPQLTWGYSTRIRSWTCRRRGRRPPRMTGTRCSARAAGGMCPERPAASGGLHRHPRGPGGKPLDAAHPGYRRTCRATPAGSDRTGSPSGLPWPVIVLCVTDWEVCEGTEVMQAVDHDCGQGPWLGPPLRATAIDISEILIASHSTGTAQRAVRTWPSWRLRRYILPRLGRRRLRSASQAARCGPGMIRSAAGISSPVASSLNVASSVASSGSVPASTSLIESRACCSHALRLIATKPSTYVCGVVDAETGRGHQPGLRAGCYASLIA